MSGSGSSRRQREIYARRERELLAAYNGTLVCHLCAGVINLNLPSRHDDSLSWDHRLPQSTHPHLANSPQNIQPAHLACNRTRQDRPLEEITGTPERVQAFADLVAANKVANAARKNLAAANQQRMTPTQRGQQTQRSATASSRHWCGPTITTDGQHVDAWCDDECPRRDERRVWDQRSGRYV